MEVVVTTGAVRRAKPSHIITANKPTPNLTRPTQLIKILFYMAFLLNIFLVSSALIIPVHALLQVNAINDSSFFIPKELHWLPIDARMKFKIATLTFKALNTSNPPYLASLFHWHQSIICHAM